MYVSHCSFYRVLVMRVGDFYRVFLICLCLFYRDLFIQGVSTFYIIFLIKSGYLLGSSDVSRSPL